MQNYEKGWFDDTMMMTMPLPNKQITDLDSFFSVESITSQDDEVFLANIISTEYIIIDSIKELSSNSAAGPYEISVSLLLNCASELAPSLLRYSTVQI